MIELDDRYSFSREYCGHIEQQWVARFCGSWIGSSPEREGAEKLARIFQAGRMGLCVECGKDRESPEKLMSGYPERAWMTHFNVCFNCAFWIIKVEQKDHFMRVEGVSYYPHAWEEGTPSYLLGFGGHAFYWVMLDDPAQAVHRSNNVMSQSNVPEHFRDRLPDNARWVTALDWDIQEISKGNAETISPRSARTIARELATDETPELRKFGQWGGGDPMSIAVESLNFPHHPHADLLIQYLDRKHRP